MKRVYTLLSALVLASISYGQQQYLKEMKIEWRDHSNNVWENSQLFEYFYNNNADTVHKRNLYWSTMNSAWEFSSFEDRYTNANGQDSLIIFKNYEPSNSTWIISGKDEYHYNTNNQLVLLEKYNYVNIETNPLNPPNYVFRYSSKDTFVYSGNLLAEKTSINFISNTNTWVNVQKIVYSYTSTLKEDEKKYYNWNQMSNSFVISSRDSSVYNSNDELIEEYYFSGSNTNANQREVYTYHPTSGKLIKKEIQYWNNMSASFNNNEYYEYIYNSNNNIDTIYHYNLEWGTTNFKVNTIRTFHYTTTPTLNITNTNLDENNFIVFPNPFNDELRINNTNQLNGKYSLVDVYGKTLINGTLDNNTTLSTNNLPANIYFLIIQSNDQKVIQKVIKR